MMQEANARLVLSAAPAKAPIRVLLVEHLTDFAARLQSMLSQQNGNSAEFEVTLSEEFATGIQLLAEREFDVALIDLSLPDGAGLSNVDQAHQLAPHVPIIVFSGVNDERVAVEAVHEGAQDYLVRDQITAQLLVRSIRYAIERQLAENAILEAEEKYRGIFEHIVEGVFQTSPDGHYLSANSALARIYGYDNPEDLIQSITDIGRSIYVDPHRRRDFVAAMQESDVLRGFESEVYRKDGTRIWISENVRAIRDAQGALVCYEGTVEDITRKRQAEEDLRNSEALYHSLVETLPQHIFRKDLEGRFTFGNQRFCQSLGVTLDELVGKTDRDFYGDTMAAKFQADDHKVVETGQAYETIEQNRPPGGSTRYVQVVKTPLVDARGQTIGLQGIFWDITEKFEAEERERKANAELARSREELRTRNAEMEEDIRMACEIQQAILPQQYPSFPPGAAADQSPVRFHHRYAPSGAVGGDYFTLIPLSPSTVGVFICDVMGHGVRSALITAMIRALVEELTHQAHDPGQLLTRLNRDLRAILKLSGSPMYATAFYLVADLITGSARFASAGHPRQILFHKPSQSLSFLPDSKADKRPPLGLVNQARYKSIETKLEPGSLLFLYTDGLLEVEGPNQDFFPIESLVQILRDNTGVSLPQLFDTVLDRIRAFSAAGTFDDDVCLLGFELDSLLPPAYEPGSTRIGAAGQDAGGRAAK